MADEGFEEFYLAHHTPLWRALIVAASGQSQVAGDCVDEAFARAYERWGRVREMDNPGGWLYRVAINELKRSHRRHARETTVGEVEGRGLDDADRTRRVEVWHAIEGLPRKQREVLALRYGSDLTEAQIAAVLEVPRGTVAAMLSRARQAIAPRLRDDQEVGHG